MTERIDWTKIYEDETFKTYTEQILYKVVIHLNKETLETVVHRPDDIKCAICTMILNRMLIAFKIPEPLVDKITAQLIELNISERTLQDKD